jgi:hypothetical protein
MWRQEPARWKRYLWEWPLYALLLLAAAAGLLAYQMRAPQVVDVGGPHDAAYLSSFHDVEPDPRLFPDAPERFRWTRAVVGFDFPGLGRQPVQVSLWMKAYRPNGEPAPEAGLWVGGYCIYSTTVGPGPGPLQWEEYRIVLPAQVLAAGDLHLELHNDTFRPAGDARDLGVTVDRVAVLPVGVGWVEPSWYQLGCLLGIALLAYLLLRRLGLARGWTAGVVAAAVMLMGHLLAYQRIWLTHFTLTIVVLLAVGCGAAALVGAWPSASARRLPRPGARAVREAYAGAGHRRVRTRASASLLPAAVLLLIALLRLGGILYPQFRTSDLMLHVHNAEYDVRSGGLFFTEPLPDINLPAPYPPGFYVAFQPLTLLSTNLPRLMQVTGVLLDALAGLLLYLLARRLTGRRDVALLALLVQQVAPVTFWIFSWGNYTNMFSRVTLLAALTLLAVGRWRWQGVRGWAVLTAAFTLVLLSHFADSLLFGGLVLATAGLALFSAATRRAVPRLLTAVLAAGGLVLALYYTAPPIWAALQGGLQALQAGVGHTGGLSNPLFQFLDRVQAPVALLALPGLALLLRRTRRWPAVVLGGALLTAAVFALGQAFVGFSSRYDYFVLPVLALGTGALLAGLRRRGWAGRAAVAALVLYLVANGVWMWVWLIGNYLHY